MVGYCTGRPEGGSSGRSFIFSRGTCEVLARYSSSTRHLLDTFGDLGYLPVTCRADIASGHFGDLTFFATPVIARLLSLLSVINIDSVFVCLFAT